MSSRAAIEQAPAETLSGRARALPGEVRRRDSLLYWTGAAHLLLAAALVLAMPFDSVEILGIDRLLKPFKFAVSIGIFAWTVAWFLPYVRAPRARSLISVVVALCMLAEIVPITGQALRGTTSHYNNATPFDGAVFGLMGTAILINTLMMALLLILLFARPAKLPPVYLWSVRLGILLFLGGSVVGYLMVANGAHTVGAPDGGPGLPLVNWSREGGDLRIAHALGLHALQIVPLVGWLLSRWSAPSGRRLVALAAVVVLYTAVAATLYLQAMAGRSLLG